MDRIDAFVDEIRRASEEFPSEVLGIEVDWDFGPGDVSEMRAWGWRTDIDAHVSITKYPPKDDEPAKWMAMFITGSGESTSSLMAIDPRLDVAVAKLELQAVAFIEAVMGLSVRL